MSKIVSKNESEISARFANEIVKLLEQFKVEVEVRVMERIATSLGVVGEVRGPSVGKTAGKVRPKKLKKHAPPAPAIIEQVFNYVRNNPGQRTEAISKGVGFHAKAALAKLRASGQVKTSGDRRTTTYKVATSTSTSTSTAEKSKKE